MKNRAFNALLGVMLAVVCVFTSSGTFSAQAAAAIPKSAATVTTLEGRLNVRKSASMNSGIITSIPKNTTVTVYSTGNGWAKVGYANGKTGYCSTDYLKTVSSSYPMKISLSNGYLNVRSGAATSSSVKGRLYNGEYVVVLSKSGKWSKIVYNGNKTGYVYSSYLVSPASRTSSASVKLNVVSFKQTDSRWSSVKLGSSGKTLGRIGCTTTCLAMTESYRTGKTITPKTMASKLSYDSGGSLYWPANYVTSTSSAGWLNRVKGMLNSGKPVIVGLKKSSGSMHWVVVTGYKNSGTDMSDFIINDPGSNTRTTLAQVAAAYPVFYKIAYYV